MLTTYLHEALRGTKVEVMENGRLFLSLSDFPGVWAEGDNLEDVRAELADVLEEWIILSIRRGDTLPVLNQCDLNAVGLAA